MLVLYSATDNAWKVADLGLTVHGEPRKPIVTDEGKGTLGYHAPEIVLAKFVPKLYTNKLDIWGLGLIIYELATGIKMFQDKQDLRKYDEEGGKLSRTSFPFHGQTSDFLYNKIVEMLHIWPDKRPDAEEVLDSLRLHKSHDNHKVKSTPYAYCLRQKSWMRCVGEDIHHVRPLGLPGLNSTTHLVRHTRSPIS